MTEDYEPKKSDTFHVCDCYAHALNISWWETEKEMFFTYWYCGQNRQYPLLSRIRWAIDMLRGDTGPTELIFNVEEAKKIRAVVDEFIRVCGEP